MTIKENQSQALQKAKDLLWDNIEPHNRELLMHMAEKNLHNPNDEIVFRDAPVIGFRKKGILQGLHDDSNQ